MSYVHFRSKDLEYKYPDIQYVINEINPYLERKRAKIYKDLEEYFITKFDEIIGIGNIEFVSSKKTSDYSLNRLFKDLFIFNLGNNKVDGFLLNPNVSYDQLIEDIQHKMPNANRDTILSFIQKLNFGDRLLKAHEELCKYHDSKVYKRVKNKFSISYEKKDSKYVTIKCVYDDRTQHEIDISCDLITKLKNKFEDARRLALNKYVVYDSGISIDTYIFCLLFRYFNFFISYNQTSLEPYTYKDLRKYYRLRFELFGSAMNTYNDNHYCSLFYDMEKYFGSCGSFENMRPIRGTYITQDHLFTHTTRRIIAKVLRLLNNSKSLSFILKFQLYDGDSIKFVKNNCGEWKRGFFYIDEEFDKDIRKLKESIFLVEIFRVCKLDLIWKSYITGQRRYIYGSSFYVLSNIPKYPKNMDKITFKKQMGENDKMFSDL